MFVCRAWAVVHSRSGMFMGAGGFDRWDTGVINICDPLDALPNVVTVL